MKSNKKKIITVIMVMALAMTMITACGSDDKDVSYLEWSGEEWNQASNEEKTEAMKQVMGEIDPEMKKNETTLASTSEAMIPSVDEMFKQSPDTKLKDIVEQIQEAMRQAETQAKEQAKSEE